MKYINLINKRNFLILVALFLTACSTTEHPFTSAATPSPILLTEVFPTPTLQPINPTLASPPMADSRHSAVKACVMPDNDKQNLSAKGVLVFSTFDLTNFKESSFLYDFDRKTVQAFPDAKDLLHLIGVSPDRKKLLYTYRDSGNLLAALADFQGKFIKKLGIQKSDGFSFDQFSWFDVNTLRAIDSSNMSWLRIYSFDIRTGHYDELRTNWPDVYRGNKLDWHVDSWSLWSHSYPGANIAGGNIAYDPTLSRIVYPKSDEHISLIDANSGKELSAIHLPDWGRIPRWSEDGRNLVLVANIDKNTFGITPIDGAMPKSARNEEFFIVSRDGGEFQQLTNLTTPSSHISIDEYAWSPNGRIIAFWLNGGSDNASLDGKMSSLMLLDVNSGEVTDLCIQGVSGFFNRTEDIIHMTHSQPIWSPDGSQIMITQLDPQDSKKYKVLIVDLASKTAYKVAENLESVGWMTKEP